MTKYRINEIFYSIQGEGMQSGRPAIFVRFSGCNLKCYFCDTNHESYFLFTLEELYQKINIMNAKTGCNNIIFTGGEPLLQPVHLLAELFPPHTICLETNGTIEIPKSRVKYGCITVSPKKINSYNINVVDFDELKFIIEPGFDETIINRFANACYFSHMKIAIQPMSQDKECTAKAIEIVKRRPNECRLSLQTQKYGNFA